jgi:hypothetical protein
VTDAPGNRRAAAQHVPSTDGHDRTHRTSTGDRAFGLGWMALGLGIVVESWRMDRLEQQQINPWTVPGLVPGLLGVVLAAFGLILALRRGGAAEAAGPLDAWRAGLAALLCLGFGAGLVGSGLPFWAATFVFVFLAILLFEWPDRRAAGTGLRGAASAGAIAAGTAAIVTLVFQEVFLVRLP